MFSWYNIVRNNWHMEDNNAFSRLIPTMELNSLVYHRSTVRQCSMFAIPDGSSNRVSTSNKCPEDTRPLDDSLLSCIHAPLPSAFEWWICISGIHALPSRLSLKNPFSHSWKHSVWSRRFVSLCAVFKIMKFN